MTSKRTEKGQKAVIAILLISFLGILLFNHWTPMLTDDYPYARLARSAGSFWGLVQQEIEQYHCNNGRSVVHLLMRIFMVFPDPVFKVVNSLIFEGMAVLIYLNIEKRNKWSPFVMLLIQLGIWIFTVDFAQTVLWKDGACNYLWGSFFILSFMTVIRLRLRADITGSSSLIPAAGFAVISFVMGFVAGWCNENTSGAGILFALILVIFSRTHIKKVPPYLITGTIGAVLGFFMMIRAPGYKVRAALTEENYSGLLKYISRFQKICLTIREYFFVLLVILMVTVVLTVLRNQKKLNGQKWTQICLQAGKYLWNRALFLFLFLAAAYALVLSPEPQPRAYFGAGIFLIIAVVQGICSCAAEEREAAESHESTGSFWVRAVIYSAAVAMTLSFVFTYIDCGTNLQRIARDIKERENYILEQKEAGNYDIIVAQLHPDFANKYSDAYNGDLTEDPGYWINVAYEEYYGVDTISAIPYDEWAEKYKN